MFLEPMAWRSLNSILQCAWLLWGCLSTSAYLRIYNVHCPVNQQLTQSFYNHNLCRLLPGTVWVKFTLVTVVDKDIDMHRHLSNQTRSGRMVSYTQVRPPVFKTRSGRMVSDTQVRPPVFKTRSGRMVSDTQVRPPVFKTRSGRMVSDTQVRPPVFKYSGCLRWLTVIFKV